MNSDNKDKLLVSISMIDQIVDKAISMENQFQYLLEKIHPIYLNSARNLLHYLAFRSFERNDLQKTMRVLGLSSLTTIEGHVLYSLLTSRNILQALAQTEPREGVRRSITAEKSIKLLRKNTKLLFGYKSKKRRTRIMVTLPEEAATNPGFVSKLIKSGMNCARINCAHNDQETWAQMIENVNFASSKFGRKCKIAMDLAGPKLRTGAMAPGPRVIHVKPSRDDHGRVIKPALFWIAPPDVLPPPHAEFDAILPVTSEFFNKLRHDDTLYLVDSRGKKGKIRIIRKERGGKWGTTKQSLYLETGTEIRLREVKKMGETINRIGKMQKKEQYITLFKGDTLIINKQDIPGEPAVRDQDGNIIIPAHISCTLPQIFGCVKKGEPIFFDDGMIVGKIIKVLKERITVRIEQSRTGGSKLRADKGINLPESQLNLAGLTEKDKSDLDFVALHADVINLSFVNSPEDVAIVQKILAEKESKAGLILKIETQKSFTRLPEILLTAMQNHPIGIMIARGDLAIETGWKNFASIQQEIMRICEAAHIPDVWATQVLESLAKKGTPSRAEITDAAVAQQAECVMLNKGPYIEKAVRMLDKILIRMERFKEKNTLVLPKLENADSLILSHKEFDV